MSISFLHICTSATRWAPTDDHAAHAPWRPDKSASSHCLSPGISGSQGGAWELSLRGASQGTSVPLPGCSGKRKIQPSPLRAGQVSAVFPGRAQKKQQCKGQGSRRHFTPLDTGSGPCTRRSQQTERFFARCFFTTNDGIKVFRRGRHGDLSGRSLDSVLGAGPSGGTGGSGCLGLFQRIRLSRTLTLFQWERSL